MHKIVVKDVEKCKDIHRQKNNATYLHNIIDFVHGWRVTPLPNYLSLSLIAHYPIHSLPDHCLSLITLCLNHTASPVVTDLPTSHQPFH